MSRMDQKIELTATEVRLLQCLLSGASNKQIGHVLGKSEFTVRNQLAVVFQKIGVANRMQAAFWFRAYWAAREERAFGTSVPLPACGADQRMGA
jgi:two-component system nitrate/nitrite response regulator NarL